MGEKPCLNKDKCNGFHPISRCPVTAAEKRRALLDKHFGKRTRPLKSTKAAVLRSELTLIRNADNGRYHICLNDVETVAR